VTYSILVGQAPARSSRPGACPLEGRCGERIARLAGLAGYDELTDACAVANLLGEWPGKAGKGDEFPRELAAASALGFHRLLGEEEWDRIVLLGRNVAAAFGLAGAPYLRWLAPTTGEPSPRGRRERRAAWYAAGAWLVPDYLQEFVWPDARWAVLPHPSGISHWWNDPANVEAAARFLRDLVAVDNSVC
jgi:hypothetical protein